MSKPKTQPGQLSLIKLIDEVLVSGLSPAIKLSVDGLLRAGKTDQQILATIQAHMKPHSLMLEAVQAYLELRREDQGSGENQAMLDSR